MGNAQASCSSTAQQQFAVLVLIVFPDKSPCVCVCAPFPPLCLCPCSAPSVCAHEFGLQNMTLVSWSRRIQGRFPSVLKPMETYLISSSGAAGGDTAQNPNRQKGGRGRMCGEGEVKPGEPVRENAKSQVRATTLARWTGVCHAAAAAAAAAGQRDSQTIAMGWTSPKQSRLVPCLSRSTRRRWLGDHGAAGADRAERKKYDKGQTQRVRRNKERARGKLEKVCACGWGGEGKGGEGRGRERRIKRGTCRCNPSLPHLGTNEAMYVDVTRIQTALRFHKQLRL